MTSSASRGRCPHVKCIRLVVSLALLSRHSSVTSASRRDLEILGKGASFPANLYQQIMYAYNLVKPTTMINGYEYGLEFKYEGVGSGAGKRAIVDQQVHFAGSDSLLSPAEKESGRSLIMIPFFAGAVVPAYNVKITGLSLSIKLSREALAGIFLGEITRWGDDRIAKWNDWSSQIRQELAERRITVLFRSDKSGTTEMLTSALTLFSDKWNQTYGVSSWIHWPTDRYFNGGISCDGGAELSDTLLVTENAIGYFCNCV